MMSLAIAAATRAPLARRRVVRLTLFASILVLAATSPMWGLQKGLWTKIGAGLLTGVVLGGDAAEVYPPPRGTECEQRQDCIGPPDRDIANNTHDPSETPPWAPDGDRPALTETITPPTVPLFEPGATPKR